ncbi:MAG TPA: cytochrome P450, partial [Alphaproteobacteria bacterium]|nr:cytochrome P450 [Alphaproteobacteria bacterium]
MGSATTDTTHEAPDRVPTGLELTALDPRFREDPYPVLHRLRALEPIHHDRVLGRVVFTRHDDVRAILYDLDLWTDPRRARPDTFAWRFLRNGDEEPSMLLMDEPGHRRLRALVSRSFTPGAVARWRPRVREVARRLVAAVAPGERDWIAEVAGPLPTVVIAELLGIEPSRHGDFKAWSDDAVLIGFNPDPAQDEIRRGERARAALDTFFREEIEARRRHPGDDLISEMLRAKAGDEQLTDDEIVRQCDLLLVAGNVTTTDLIGNGTKALARHPEQQSTLRARPEWIPNAVEETLRYDSPVTNSGRIASRDMEIGGTRIERGETLSVSLAAANRD